VQLPLISGPTLMVVPNPVSPRHKLLLVMGRDTAELRTATEALTLGQIALSGPSAVIKNLKEPELRKAYDAPKWLPTHRPVKFGELATMDSLQVSGLTPDLIRINMRVAPDLFTWQRDGVPIDLRYRFTPRPTVDKSTLNIGINDGFVRALSLSGADIEKGKSKSQYCCSSKKAIGTRRKKFRCRHSESAPKISCNSTSLRLSEAGRM
jgi:hypothetical protein